MPVLTEELTRMKGHRWQISSLAFNTDGSVLASAGWDKEVNLWDLSNLEVVHNLKGVHKVPITTVSWHRPSNLLLCTGSADNTAALWDPKTGRHLSTLTEHFGWVLGSSFSATGSSLATASWDKTVRIWDPGTSTLVNNLNGHQLGVWSVDFHPRSSLLCSASQDGTVKLWDERANKTIRTFTGGHSDAVCSAKWSPDGAMIASGSADGNVCIWEPGQGKVINTIYGHDDAVKDLVFNPHTQNVALPLLASAGGYTLRLSDPRPQQKPHILTLTPHNKGKEVEAVAISPDGSLLVTGGRDGLIVLMTLFVPSIMPRSESTYSTSSVLRRSRVIRDRSYIHDVTTEGDILLEMDEEEEQDLEAELELEALDQILAEPSKKTMAQRQTSFSRMKRQSRLTEKESELPDYATVKKKGVTARTARGKRYKQKAVDIPTMVAHLSAAVRAYGPEELSSSESEGEEDQHIEPERELGHTKSSVDVGSRVITFSNPHSFDVPVEKSGRKLSVDVGKLEERKKVFSKLEQEEKGDQLEAEFLQGMPGELESHTLDDSLPLDAQSLVHASGHYRLGASGDDEDHHGGFLTSSPIRNLPPGVSGNKKRGFVPSLSTAAEDEESYFDDDDVFSGEEYGDEIPLSEI